MTFLVLLAATALVVPRAAHQADAFPAPPQAEAPNATDPPAPVAAQPVAEVPAPPLERWRGTRAAGYAGLREFAGRGALDEALARADALLAANAVQRWHDAAIADRETWRARFARAVGPRLARWGWLGPSDAERGELRFAKGVLHAQRARAVIERGGEEAANELLAATEAAAGEFSAARALAGPGELRRDATYDLAHVWLERAEEARLAIPEVRARLGLPELPPPPDGASSPRDGDLDVARALYLTAREPLVERLRVDWRDADVRANTELVQRRLRELEEIRRQREEQQQQEQQQDSQDQQQGEQGEPSPDQQPSEQQQDQEQPPADGEQEEREPSEPGEDEPRPGEGEPESDEAQPSAGEETTEAKEVDPERFLTREEALRLLDRLRRLEEEGERIQAQLQRGRRTPVKKDW